MNDKIADFIDDLAEQHTDHLLHLIKKHRADAIMFNPSDSSDPCGVGVDLLLKRVSENDIQGCLYIETTDGDILYRLKELARTDLLHYMAMKEYELERVRPGLLREYRIFSSNYLLELLTDP